MLVIFSAIYMCLLSWLVDNNAVHAYMNTTSGTYVCSFARNVQKNNELKAYLWGKAQEAIGIQPDYGKLKDSPFLQQFYGGRSFGFSAYIIHDKPVLYQRIWENGNSAIRVSFFVYLRDIHPKSNFCYRGGEKCIPENFDFTEASYKRVTEMLSKRATKAPSMFTFVRRPISHFVSGLREYYYLRDYHNDHEDMVNVEELALFLRTLLDVNSEPPDNVFAKPFQGHINLVPHMYPQATTFREQYGSVMVGKMEEFSKDWRLMQADMGIDTPIKQEYGVRPSSKDGHKVGDNWTKLVTAQPAYLRALCWLLLPDFMCFNYPLPTQCEDIVYTMKHGNWSVGL